MPDDDLAYRDEQQRSYNRLMPVAFAIGGGLSAVQQDVAGWSVVVFVLLAAGLGWLLAQFGNLVYTRFTRDRR